jgi:hypothetical protein
VYSSNKTRAPLETMLERYHCPTMDAVFFFNWYSVGRGGVQLGPLGTAATNRPTVPTPGDYDDREIGGMIGSGNRSTRKKPAPSAALSTTNPTCCPDANAGLRGGKPATNRLSYGQSFFFNYLVCEAIGAAATPGLL